MLHEIKGKLAKLLATENLIIEHRNVETAQFDVVRRVLTLPVWQIQSEDVYDLLVAHEVGHALYTDDREWNKVDEWKDIPRSYVNITEDARIEKLMKRRYAGLNKTFYRGYNTLHDQDFFELQGEDLDNFSLPDRINLHFKVGSYLNINFTEEEWEIVKLVSDAETFDDAINAALTLHKFIQKNKQEMQEERPIQIQTKNTMEGGEGEQEDIQEEKEWFTDDDPEEREAPEQDDPAQLDVPSYEYDTEEHPEEEAQTVKALDQNLRNIASKQDEDIVYLNHGKIDLKHIIAENKFIHDYTESYWAEFQDKWTPDYFDTIDSEYKKFKRDAQKEVNYLVKEFECKKSASNYARATTSRTGVLDMSKLHTYKYNEDLFKKVTVIPDGKNHGLIFVLDWSGSMAHVLQNTIKQLYNLVWFCRKVNIPYDVYAFTNEWHYRSTETPYLEKQKDTIHISDDFAMMNLLTSKVNTQECERQLRNLWRIAWSYSNGWGIAPPRMGLSGTPLNEAILTLHEIIPDFKKRFNVEKVNCVILTDGEANPCSRLAVVKRDWENDPVIRCRRIHDQTFLRNKKTGSTIRLTGIWYLFTKIILDDLKETFPEVNFIGFRVMDGGLSSMLSTYIPDFDTREKARKQWKSERSFSIKDMGYDTYFVLAATALSASVDFEVDEEATKAQIKNAFKKSLSSKKTNKRVLSEFVELVA